MTLLYESYSFETKKRMRAAKKRFATPTILLTTIGRIVNGTWESLEGRTVPAGTEIRISGTLYTDTYAFVGADKPIKIYVKLPGSATYTLLTTVNTVEPSNFHYMYVLGAGDYLFYCEFEGDSEYEGCP